MKLSKFKESAVSWLYEGESWGSVCEKDHQEVLQIIEIIENIGNDLKLKGVEPDDK